MASFGRLEKRFSDVFTGLAPDFNEYVGFAHWNRNHAIAYGPFHNRFELHVHAYAKAMQLVRHHYFREVEQQRRISLVDAISLFSDEGYEIGFNTHWTHKLKRDCATLTQILHAPSIEAGHQIIGDYEPLTSDGRPLRQIIVDMPVSISNAAYRAA